jgi:transposase
MLNLAAQHVTIEESSPKTCYIFMAYRAIIITLNLIFLRRCIRFPRQNPTVWAEWLVFEYVLADRSYTAQHFTDTIAASGAQAVIPPKQNAKQPHDHDAWRCRERHLVECFIGIIKRFRRVFSRFDKLARRYPGFVQFASALIWLR